MICPKCGNKTSDIELNCCVCQTPITSDAEDLYANGEFVPVENWDTFDNKNGDINDYEYEIKIFGSSYTIPKYCSCCMTPTEEMEYVSYSTTESTPVFGGTKHVTRTISCQTPLCSDCLEHRRKVKFFKNILLVLSTFVGVLSTIIVFSLDNIKPYLLLIPIAMILLCYFGVSSLIKLPQLQSNHSSRNESVEIFKNLDDENSKSIVFRFQNPLYAAVFCQSNIDKVMDVQKKKKRINSIQTIPLIKVIKNRVGHIFGMLISLIVICGLLLSITDCTGCNLIKKPQPPIEDFTTTQKVDSEVYANIISIEPIFGLYEANNTNYTKTYTDFICECMTNSSKKIYVVISVDDYRIFFDKSATATWNILGGNSNNEKITFDGQKRIVGKCVEANSISMGLRSDINSEFVLGFEKVE